MIAIKLSSVVEEAVEVGVFAGQNAGSRGAADGVSAKAVFKKKAFICDAVDGWSGGKFIESASRIS